MLRQFQGPKLAPAPDVPLKGSLAEFVPKTLINHSGLLDIKCNNNNMRRMKHRVL